MKKENNVYFPDLGVTENITYYEEEYKFLIFFTRKRKIPNYHTFKVFTNVVKEADGMKYSVLVSEKHTVMSEVVMDDKQIKYDTLKWLKKRVTTEALNIEKHFILNASNYQYITKLKQ